MNPEKAGTFGTGAGPAAGAGPAFDLTELCTVVDCLPTKGVVTKTTYNPKTGLASRGI